MSKNYDNLNNNDVFLLFSINSPSFDCVKRGILAQISYLIMNLQLIFLISIKSFINNHFKIRNICKIIAWIHADRDRLG